MDTCIGWQCRGIDADTRLRCAKPPPDPPPAGPSPVRHDPGQSLVLPLPERASPAQVMLVFREARRPVTCSFLVTRLGHCGIAPAHARGILAELQRTGLLTVLPQPLPVHVTGPGAPSSTLVQALMRRGIAAEPIVPGSAAFGHLTLPGWWSSPASSSSAGCDLPVDGTRGDPPALCRGGRSGDRGPGGQSGVTPA